MIGAIQGCRGGILPRPTRSAVVAATCPDGLLPRTSRGEGWGGGSPCRAAADAAADKDNDGSHIGNVRVDDVVEDNGNDNDLDDNDDDKGEDENGDNNEDDAVVLGEATAAAALMTRMAVTMAKTTKVTWTAMAEATTTTTSMPSTMTMTMMRQRRCDGDNDNGMMTMERQQCDGIGLTSAVPPIRGNNQLMSTVCVCVCWLPVTDELL
jgi:hypothetical protein